MSMAVAKEPNTPQSTELADDPRLERLQDVPAEAREPAARPADPRSGGEAAAASRLAGAATQARLDLSEPERRLLGDLFAIVSEHAADSVVEIDRGRVQDAFVFACEHHAAQRRKSGEDFIVHPVGVARICAGMRLDTETLCAALLHDTVEDTSASIEEVRERFGEEIAAIVDGVTKLTGITFQSHDEAQAENYRKMMVAMATDVRVILIKLADRLHNMRTIEAMSKQKQMEKARETLEIYAPLAHRLGIHAIKWELEDLAFATLHPRKYQEIKGLVAQQRDDREGYVSQAGEYLSRELAELGIQAQIAGRAKHFYSIYSKMTKKGREFNEIYDLTAMRVIVDSVKDCYGTVGVIHSLWKPLPGRFKDFIAMPKFNMYQSLHTTVIGPEGRPLEIQIRTQEMHEMAEFGVAAHWVYKQGPRGETPARREREAATAGRPGRGRQAEVAALDARLAEGALRPARVHGDAAHRPVRGRGVRVHAEGRSQVAGGRRDAAGLRLRGAHRDRPPLRGRARERQDRPAALRAALGRHRGDPHRQARARPLARLAGDGQDDPRAQQDQGVVQGGVAPGHRAHRARAAAGAPAQTGPARAEDHRLGAAGRRDPRGRLPQGRRLLHRPGGGQGLAQAGRQQGDAAPQAGRGGRRRGERRRPAARRSPAAAPDQVLGPVRDQGRRRGRRDAAAGQVLPAGARR